MRDLLRAILQIAVLNGWLPLNYVNSAWIHRSLMSGGSGLGGSVFSASGHG